MLGAVDHQSICLASGSSGAFCQVGKGWQKLARWHLKKSVFFALETTILYTLHPRKSGGFVGYRRGPWCRAFQLDRESLVPPSWVGGQSLSGLIQQSLQDRTSLGAARKGEVHQRAIQCAGCVLRICCRNCLKPVELRRLSSRCSSSFSGRQ